MGVISFSEANCKNCYACVRACPVQSIKIKNEQAIIMEERCIACGLCLKACPKNVKKIETELEKVKQFIKSGQSVVVSLAPTAFGVFKNQGHKLVAALKKLGVSHVEETVVGAEVVTQVYETYQHFHLDKCYITSCCASVNLLIEKHYPKVIPHLIPVITPLMAHARMLKLKYGQDVKVVFVGPCLAKKIEGEEEESISAVLTIQELKQWFNEAGIKLNELEEVPLDDGVVSQRTYPMVGGMSKCFNEKDKKIEIVSVDGIRDCIEVIEGIERGEFKNIFFEMSACHHSCLGGPAIGEECENIFNRKMRIKDYARQTQPLHEMSEGGRLPLINLNRVFKNQYSPIIQPSEKEIELILNNIGKYSSMDELNCGSCGYPTCRQKAIAVYNHMAEPTMCLPYMKHKAETYSHVIFDVTPSIILVVDKSLTIIDFNPAAERFFEVKKDQAIDLPVSIFLDEASFSSVIESKSDLLGHRLSLNENKTIVIQSIIWIEQQEVMLCILHDMTSEMAHELKMQHLKINAIDMAQQVINKQMIVAQEIASLLGETTAETKVTLTRLKRLIQEDEGGLS
ncbi:[Fe-Fe] hydrogenase large subunit C-terminal domain-containing protein [Turicibacter sp.]|uniref:[Fe-Fe] hydrogenase large subunit C-terminal domain-containing protein n=1 Tax=Turicibacter sp. TaxID=2049042 RepID=UPI001B6394FD|nr:[Fe-Fe] hydrogenase large subunit C-terminal domain-containing protein [Turicibacter sp.]MBP3903445.1 4Fe-4S binding protein [Turicibacter sp.]